MNNISPNFSWKIRIGDTNHNSSADDANVEELSIIDATKHPKYKQSFPYYDVAVLKTLNITLSKGKIPVCLPNSPNIDVNKYDDKFAELIGWGSSHINGNPSHKLRRVNIKVFPQR
jgi:hypothetical protein